MTQHAPSHVSNLSIHLFHGYITFCASCLYIYSLDPWNPNDEEDRGGIFLFQSSSKYSFLLLTTLSPDEDELSFFCPPMDPREMFESVLRLKEPLDTVATTKREKEKETDR